MEYRLIWLDTARTDLNTVYCFNQSKGIKYAKNIVNHIIDTSFVLKRFPYSGPTESLLAGRDIPYRSLVIDKHHKVIYFIEEEAVYIAAVWDTRQDPDLLTQAIK